MIVLRMEVAHHAKKWVCRYRSADWAVTSSIEEALTFETVDEAKAYVEEKGLGNLVELWLFVLEKYEG